MRQTGSFGSLAFYPKRIVNIFIRFVHYHNGNFAIGVYVGRG
jgi:hypothetical protein